MFAEIIFIECWAYFKGSNMTPQLFRLLSFGIVFIVSATLSGEVETLKYPGSFHINSTNDLNHNVTKLDETWLIASFLRFE